MLSSGFWSPDRQRLRVSGFYGVLLAKLPEAKGLDSCRDSCRDEAAGPAGGGKADPGRDLTEASQTLEDAAGLQASSAQPELPVFSPNGFIDLRLLPETGPGTSVPLEEQTPMLGCTCLQVVGL